MLLSVWLLRQRIFWGTSVTDTSERTKIHRPVLVGLTVMLTCEDCGIKLPLNYVCPMCRWEQYFTEDGEEVMETCIPCLLHGG